MFARRALPLVIASFWLATTIGAAASLGTTSDSIGAVTVAMARCTTAALTVTTNLSGTTVASVTVAGIPSSCGGAVLQVALHNGSTSSSGSGTVAAGGGSSTIPLAVAQAATASELIDVVMTGP